VYHLGVLFDPFVFEYIKVGMQVGSRTTFSTRRDVLRLRTIINRRNINVVVRQMWQFFLKTRNLKIGAVFASRGKMCLSTTRYELDGLVMTHVGRCAHLLEPETEHGGEETKESRPGSDGSCQQFIKQIIRM